MEIPIAPVTYALIVANLAASCWAFFFDDEFSGNFAFDIDAIKRHGQHYRIFTSSFLHVDPMHLLFNMITLFFFGPDVERVLGQLGFLVVYFGAILFSGILSYYLNRNNSVYTSVGASDATSGIVFSFVVIAPFVKLVIFPIPVPMPAWVFGIVFVLISSVLMNRQDRVISHEGHLGGAIAGLLLTIAMHPILLTRWFA